MSKLTQLYYKNADLMLLPPLKDIRSTISLFYTTLGKKHKKTTFLYLGDVIEFKFIKKIIYICDFSRFLLYGICGIIVFSFRLIRDGIELATIRDIDLFFYFHSDMLFMLLISINLAFSSYPFWLNSFDCNMQEKKPDSPYALRLTKLLLIFTITSMLSSFLFYYLGFIKIAFY